MDTINDTRIIKRCPKCGVTKPISEFYTYPGWCKKCDNARPRKRTVYHKKYQRKRRAAINDNSSNNDKQ